MNDLTDEWLGRLEDAKKRGEVLADSIFWRLAVDFLPLGVDPDDELVKGALEEIRASISRREEQAKMENLE